MCVCVCREVFVKRKGSLIESLFYKKVLASTYFPTHKYAVSSAMEGLTAEFGMVSGVPPPPWTPRQNMYRG